MTSGTALMTQSNKPLTSSDESDLADELYAANVVKVYLASYGVPPHDRVEMSKQLIRFLVGKRRAVVAKLTDPSCGAVVQSERPSLFAVKRWYDEWTGAGKTAPVSFRNADKANAKYDRNGRYVGQYTDDATEEERARNVERLRQVRLQIQMAAEKCDPDYRWSRAEKTDGKRLMEGLANLEAEKPETLDGEEATADEQ